MPEVTYIGLEALLAKGRAAVLRAVTQADEDLVARQMEAAPVDTGTLRASIHVESIVESGDTVQATNATGGESSAYAIFVHEGTGAHIIRARDGGFLAWPGADHPVREVHHPGTRANPFMGRPLIENIALYERAMIAAAAGEF